MATAEAMKHGVQEHLHVRLERLLPHAGRNLRETLPDSLMQVDRVGKVLQASDLRNVRKKPRHFLWGHLGELPEHVQGSVRCLPGLLLPAEAMVHASAPTLEFWSQRAAGEHRLVCMQRLVVVPRALCSDTECRGVVEPRIAVRFARLLLGVGEHHLHLLHDLVDGLLPVAADHVSQRDGRVLTDTRDVVPEMSEPELVEIVEHRQRLLLEGPNASACRDARSVPHRPACVLEGEQESPEQPRHVGADRVRVDLDHQLSDAGAGGLANGVVVRL
mmetsp:Transcript_8428/g.20233  ORF Transcript_8428/g.20233 Transcript_8428/m.20233 type:complete len:274 (+) Transcript_8428:432-1253(+)